MNESQLAVWPSGQNVGLLVQIDISTTPEQHAAFSMHCPGLRLQTPNECNSVQIEVQFITFIRISGAFHLAQTSAFRAGNDVTLELTVIRITSWKNKMDPSAVVVGIVSQHQHVTAQNVIAGPPALT